MRRSEAKRCAALLDAQANRGGEAFRDSRKLRARTEGFRMRKSKRWNLGYAANRRAQRAMRRVFGICLYCPNRAREGSTRCDACLEMHRLKSKALRERRVLDEL